MRKSVIILFLLLAVSCQKEPAPQPVVSDVPIEFSSPQTKGSAALSTLERLANQRFGVCAWYTSEGNTFGTGSKRYLENHRFGCTDAPSYTTWCGVTNGGEADPVYYPLDGSLSYFCYAPYRDNIQDGGGSDVQIVYNPSSTITSQLPQYLEGSPLIRFTPDLYSSSQIDFIAAAPVLDARREGGAIPLDFTHHLTTKLEFWCKYSGAVNSGVEGVLISRIVLRNIISSEYLYFTENNGVLGHAWCNTISPEDGGSTMPLDDFILASDHNALITDDPFLDSVTPKWVNNTISGITYMLPQTLPSGAMLDVTYQIQSLSTHSVLEENTVSVSLSGTEAWPLGKIMRYTLTIGVPPRKDISMSVSIIDWEEANNTHPGQELMY